MVLLGFEVSRLATSRNADIASFQQASPTVTPRLSCNRSKSLGASHASRGSQRGCTRLNLGAIEALDRIWLGEYGINLVEDLRHGGQICWAPHDFAG